MTIEQDINNFYIKTSKIHYSEVKDLVKRAKKYNICIDELIDKIEYPFEEYDLENYSSILYKLRIEQFIDYTKESLELVESKKLEKLLIYLEVKAEQSVFVDGASGDFACEILRRLDENVFGVEGLLLLEKKKDFIID